MENQSYSGTISTFDATPGILAENIVKDIPDIQMASQMLWEEEPLFTVDNTYDKEKGRLSALFCFYVVVINPFSREVWEI